MAEKGARAQLEPVARQMYVDGQSLTAIAETLGVSRNTLTEWKARTKAPSDEKDEWDKSREMKRGFEHRLEVIRDGIMQEIEETTLVSIKNVSPALFDSLSKVDALLDRNRKAARDAQDAIARQRGEMFLQFIKDLIEYGGKHDEQITAAIQDNFDDLIQWGREKYAA
jgi:restriction endonuclease Mrr